MAASFFTVTNGATPATPGSGKTVLFVNASKQLCVLDDTGTVTILNPSGPAATQSSPAAPTGTTDTTGKMMGLAGSITPTTTGRVVVAISGNLSNSTGAAGNGAQARMRYGTGSAPANGAALTGTTFGSAFESMVLERATASDPYPFCLVGLITGLTLNTAIWLDVQLAAISGGTATLGNLSITAFEV